MIFLALAERVSYTERVGGRYAVYVVCTSHRARLIWFDLTPEVVGGLHVSVVVFVFVEQFVFWMSLL